jgi:hypothetical protein
MIITCCKGPRFAEIQGPLKTFPEFAEIRTSPEHRCFTIRILQELSLTAITCFVSELDGVSVDCHPNADFCPVFGSGTSAILDLSADRDVVDFDGRLNQPVEINNESRVHLRSPRSQVSSIFLI